MNTRDRNIFNPEQHMYNSSFKITRRADSLKNLDFMFQGLQHKSSYAHQNSFFNEIKQREQK